jgi:HlyD family secretion protein
MQTKGKQQSGAPAAESTTGRALPIRRILLILVVIGFAAFWAWRFFQPKPHGTLFVSGRIEGYETNVGAKIGGRVNWIKYREGNSVQRDELIVRISDEEIQAQLRGAGARLEQATQQEAQSAYQLRVVESQIEEARLNVAQSREDMAGRILQARSSLASAQAQLAESESQLQQAQADLQLAAIRKERYGRLLVKGAVTQDQYDQAATTYATACATEQTRRAAVEAQKREVGAQQGLLTQALTTRLNPSIRQAQLSGYEKQLKAARAQLLAAQHNVANALAAKQEILANIAYLNIKSPINGIVTARPVEPGNVVVAGQTVLSLINLDTVYLRGFVPEGDIGNVRVGQDSRIYLDSSPKKPYPGKVIEIDPEASFTPENIYFKSDRVKQVFGIKIGIHAPGGYCKPGMPADAEIITGAE